MFASVRVSHFSSSSPHVSARRSLLVAVYYRPGQLDPLLCGNSYDAGYVSSDHDDAGANEYSDDEGLCPCVQALSGGVLLLEVVKKPKLRLHQL